MTDHPNEEQLVLYYYGEAPEAAEHLTGCEHCRVSYQALQRVLNSVDSLPVPERDEHYEARVWGGIEGQVRPQNAWYLVPWCRVWPGWRPVAVMATMGGMLLVAFLAGRGSLRPVPAVADAAQLRERVLLVALGAHLERTRILLVELSHAQAKNGHFDIAWEQGVAENLLEANRLYRQTAASNGDYAVIALLEELERVMLELAHSPPSVPEPQLEELRHRVEERSLLFKVNVFRSQFESRESGWAINQFVSGEDEL